MDILVTRRLTLRPPLEVDVDAMTAALQNSDVTRMLTNVPNPYSSADALAFIKRTGEDKKSLAFSIYRQKFLGVISVAEDSDGNFALGYWLERNCWGNGYMSEAARAVLSHAFRSLGVDQIVSDAYQDNRASLAIQDKLGFEICGKSSCINPTRKCEVETIRTELTRQRFEQLFGSLESEAAA